MDPTIENLVVDFYSALFDRMFTEPFRFQIAERIKQRGVERQIEAAADAASQSLTRFFVSQQLDAQQVSHILNSLVAISDMIALEHVANPNIAPESVAEGIAQSLTCPDEIFQAHHQAIYSLALNAVVQVLMLVGPVMAEWRTVNFSSTYELLSRVTSKLNQISEQLTALGSSHQAAADDSYELIYRDHLLQRFYRVEAGTVRMTTNLNVDIRELFVMPKIIVRPQHDEQSTEDPADTCQLMDLDSARKSFADSNPWDDERQTKEKRSRSAIEQVLDSSRNVLVGLPGSGKSTFLEWLQLKLAAGEEVLIAAGKQVIPLLLRVRELDLHNLPHGATLIERATRSKDRAVLMPHDWIERQMQAGRILFMLDGLDETEPELRDRYLLPWLRDLCRKYPDCRYLISSRPVGYPSDALDTLDFAECDVEDFGREEIGEYARHWCVSVRLAQHETKEEAEREGRLEGEKIVIGFKDHLYIRNLARNPLMLSAICLVNYFEGGELPKDRSMLYRLCVEGLLHHWDQRRGIHSEFSLEAKLRACREVALAMQADNRAEYEAQRVQEIFAGLLANTERASSLVEHIRYRTGLLLERRPGIFAFAHLTFQEYLAATAVHEGNHLNVVAEQLAHEHNDGRWNEVIALYCGIAPTPAVRHMIESLIKQPDTKSIAMVLGEAYLSTNSELLQDSEFRKRVLRRIALAPNARNRVLSRFSIAEVGPIADEAIGTIVSEINTSEAFQWFIRQRLSPNIQNLLKGLNNRQNLSSTQLSELVYLLHAHAPDEILSQIVTDSTLYMMEGPVFADSGINYELQLLIALFGLVYRVVSPVYDTILIHIAEALEEIDQLEDFALFELCNSFEQVIDRRRNAGVPSDAFGQTNCLTITRRLKEQLVRMDSRSIRGAIKALEAWASVLEGAIREQAQQSDQPFVLSHQGIDGKTRPRPKGSKRSGKGG